MDWKQIDKRLIELIDIEFYSRLDLVEAMIFDLKYIRLMPNHQIADETSCCTTKVKQIVKGIRCKYMEYINAKEV